MEKTNKQKEKFRFWVEEVEGYSAIDEEGKKYMLSVIQDMNYNNRPLGREEEERVILYVYDLDYVEEGEMIVESEILERYKSTSENVNHVLEYSEFSVSY